MLILHFHCVFEFQIYNKVIKLKENTRKIISESGYKSSFDYCGKLE